MIALIADPVSVLTLVGSLAFLWASGYVAGRIHHKRTRVYPITTTSAFWR